MSYLLTLDLTLGIAVLKWSVSQLLITNTNTDDCYKRIKYLLDEEGYA